MAGLRGAFFDTSVLVAGIIDFGSSSRHALLLMDAVADGRIENPMTAWHCCLEFFSVSTRLPAEFRLAPADAAKAVKIPVIGNGDIRTPEDAANNRSDSDKKDSDYRKFLVHSTSVLSRNYTTRAVAALPLKPGCGSIYIYRPRL